MSNLNTAPPATPESPDDENTRACREGHVQRMTELRAAWETLMETDLSDESREAIESEFTPLEIQERRQLKILLSWGGPSDGYILTFDKTGTDLLSGVYFHADWFTYAEEAMMSTDAELVVDVYLHGDATPYFTAA
jgi:hypothetical protein